MEHISNHLQKWEHPKQELTGPRVGEFTSSFDLAIEFPPLVNQPVEELTGVLKWVMVKIGLRAANWPNDIEKNVLIDHIRTNYGRHSISEIKLAFNMAIMGKLDVEVNCYENFSCLYFSTIMNAYRQWAKDQYKEIKPVMIENKEKLSDTTMQEWLEDCRKGVKEGRLTPDLMPIMLYDHLQQEGKIGGYMDSDNLTIAAYWRQKQLIDAAATLGKADIQRLREFNAMFREECFEGEEVNRLKNLSKKMILWDYLKQ